MHAGLFLFAHSITDDLFILRKKKILHRKVIFELKKTLTNLARSHLPAQVLMLFLNCRMSNPHWLLVLMMAAENLPQVQERKKAKKKISPPPSPSINKTNS